ncbi:MAG: autoinducer-2 kinase [Acidimicrobiales bacterium]
MSAGYLLAIDVGTGSARAVLFGPDGRQAGIGQREYSHREAPGVPGSQVFDTTANWSLVTQCVHEALAKARVVPTDVRAVSASSMREGMVLYDARGQEIWACPNADSRGVEEATELVNSGRAQEIYDLAGDWVSITSPARFLWIARHEPELFSQIAHVNMLGDWVLTKLTGEFVTDASLGSSSGLFDLAKRDWSDRVLAICGLSCEIFPPIVESGTVIGTVTAKAAEETGLKAGTPVVVGGADTQLGLLGIGVNTPGRLTVLGGSFWQTTMLFDHALIDPGTRLRTLCHTSPGLWMMEGIGFYCGLVMRWFRDAFCELELAEAAARGVDVYSILEDKASALPPGAHGVIGLFSNVMQASRWVHTTPGFIGFDVANPDRSGRVECFRSIEEAAAYVALAHLRIIEEVAGSRAETAVFTGGAAKGHLWPQIVADTLGMPVHIPVEKESTALGAAICAGVGTGLWKSTDEAAEAVAAFERIVEPEPEASAAYRELADDWLKIYRGSMELAESGLVRPLWRAAGT